LKPEQVLRRYSAGGS